MAVLESRLARRNSVRRAQHELKQAAQQTLGAQPASPKRVCSNAFQSAVVQKNGSEKRAERSSDKGVAQLPTKQPNSMQTFAFRRSLLRRKAVCRSLLSLLIVCIAPSYGSLLSASQIEIKSGGHQ